MNKSKYKKDKKEISDSQKHLKKVYKEERTPRKEVIKNVLNKANKRIHRKREQIKKLELQVKFAMATFKVQAAVGTNEDVEEELRFIADNVGNV